jgi:integrase/recombinase XerD
MPAELEWFANIDNPRTRRAYRTDIQEFSRFVGIAKPEEMRSVTRSHLIAWRKQLELRNLAGSTIRRKLSAVASLFDSLCERNAVTHNAVRGVKRPRVDGKKAKRLHSAMARHERSSRLLHRRLLRESAIARS